MNVAELATPALCVDLDALERNLERMQSFFRHRSCTLRPHFNAHKTPAIAMRQVAKGCAGFACATVGEAEVLARHGFTDLLIANEVLDPSKLDRLRTLTESALVTVAIDSLDGVALLKDLPIGAAVDVNIGQRGRGAPPEEVAGIAGAVVETELHLRGVIAYEGHAAVLEDPGRRSAAARQAVDVLLRCVGELREAGFEIGLVSAGDTRTFEVTASTDGVTEARAGRYALMDRTYARYGLPFEEALRCLTTVLGRHGDTAVLDAGLKAVLLDLRPSSLPEGTAAEVVHVSDERTILAVHEGFDLRPGDRTWLRPSHADATVNLHGRLYAVRGERVVDEWHVAARGYSR